MWERFGPGGFCPHKDNTAVSLTRALWERGGEIRQKYKQDNFRQPQTSEKQPAEPGGADALGWSWD